MANIEAAGAVVTRAGGQVLLVHRPKYDDWSFPKGKIDRGEHATAAAVREVAEETGLRVRLGPALSSQSYAVGARSKVVHYWTARVVGEDDVSGYVGNDEIDRVTWVPVEEAPAILSYGHDRATLAEALAEPTKTRALLVVRHGKAHSRGSWHADDRRRPLVATGKLQAERLVPLLAAYDVTRVVSSSSTRCVETMQPYADVAGRPVTTTDALSEQDATAASVGEVITELLEAGVGAAVCSHRPVLPRILDAIGLAEVNLDTGEVLVVHHRKDRIVALERHQV